MKIILAAMAIFLLVRPLQAAEISLDEFLDNILQSHPLIKQEDLSREIELKIKERFLTEQDWFITAGPSLRHSEIIATGPFSPNRITELNLNANAERLFWNNGSRLSLGWQSLFRDQDLNRIDVGGMEIPTGEEKYIEHRLSLRYTLPLMQNRGGILDRLDYYLADYDVAAAEVNAAENKEKYLNQLGAKYLDWVLLEEHKRIALDRFELAMAQLRDAESKRDANLVDRVDVLRSEDAVNTARQNILLLESRLRGIKTELAVLSQNDSLIEAKPDYDIYARFEIPSATEAFNEFRQDSRLIAVLELQRNRLTDEREGYREREEPRLDFTFGLDMKGGDDDPFASLEITKPDFMVAFNYAHFLGARGAGNDISRTNLLIQQLDYSIAKLSLDLKAALFSLTEQIRQLEKVLDLNLDQIASAEEKTAEELKLYDQGRGQLTFVIQSRDNEENAKSIYAENAATYHKLLLQYREVTDQILEIEFKGTR